MAACYRAVLGSPGGSLEVEDLAMVQETVDDGRREGHVLHQRAPFGQALVTGDNRGPSFVAPGDEFIEGGPEGRLGGQIAEFVQHEDVAVEERAQESLPSGRRRPAPEWAGEPLGGDEARRVAELYELGGDADGQHGFPQARR